MRSCSCGEVSGRAWGISSPSITKAEFSRSLVRILFAKVNGYCLGFGIAA